MTVFLVAENVFFLLFITTTKGDDKGLNFVLASVEGEVEVRNAA